MPVPKGEVLELMRMEVDPAEVDEIRDLWKAHSKAEDARSIEGLLATLTPDCVYTVFPDDVSWHGHEGAARFYTELLTAFGVNFVVYPPQFRGPEHYHDSQDELYFVHSGTAKVEVGGEERTLETGGVFHVQSTTPRRISNAGDEPLVLLVVGGKDGYVERDGHVMSDDDLKIRQGIGSSQGGGA